MVNVLNVAEKPSVAKSVASILSHNQMRMREGRSIYNKIFEFDYSINGQQCHMLFTSVSGHLMELEFDDRFRKWNSCDPADLYSAPVRKTVPEDKQNIRRTLEEESRKCQWLLLWLDCDREGENIAFEVIEVCTAINSRLDIRRARFSALIEREIHHAVQNLVAPNKWFSDAVDARQEIDLRIGASFTRFQTMLLRDKFVIDYAQDDRNHILSYGPCQFPTLGFIVEQYWEVQSHEPEEFWSINCSHSRGRLFDYTAAVIIYEMCVEEATATVTKVQQQQTFSYPPYPLSTLELEKCASRYFRMSSELTMKVAEELYQAGLISYPRTETDCFSEKTDLRAIVREQQENPVWGSYAQRLLDPEEGLWRNPRNGGHDDNAHPPIHPTKPFSSESRWNQNHQNIYELVARNFLACVSKPAVAAETVVDIDIAGETFSSSGKMILERNYLDVYRFNSWGGSMIPSYVERQQFLPTSLTLVSGVTSPPPLLSESDLLSRMDKAGIGTDATMHEHIKKLLDRFYATKDSNLRFSPTKLGEALVLGYDAMGHELWKPNLRSMMEADMKQVSVGNKSKEDVLSTSLQQMKTCFLDAKLKKDKLFESMGTFFARANTTSGIEQRDIGDVVRPCSQCGVANMLLKKNREGNLMVGCSGYPQCKNVFWLPGPVLEASVTSTICQSCSPGPVYLIQFKFRQCEIPPGFDVNHLGCIGGCDVILKQLTEICGTGARARGNGRTLPNTIHQSGTQQTSASGRTRANAIHQSGTHSTSCSHCSRPGHESYNCPHRRSVPQQLSISDNGNSSVHCSNCGESCSVKTANTANNRGRRFYTCASGNCNFFVWEDAMSSNGAASDGRARGRGGGRGRGTGRRERGRGNRTGDVSGTTFVSATGGPVSGRCFSCGDPSHFANNCPNRNL